jgi:hypothetical protein
MGGKAPVCFFAPFNAADHSVRAEMNLGMRGA